jgi:hypothetical protein
MKVMSVFCLALILLGFIASKKLKTSTKNFTKTCRNYSISDDKTVLSAECKTERQRYNKTSINLYENLVFHSSKHGLSQIGRCVTEEPDLEQFSFKLYCNLKLDDGSIKKFTGFLDLSIYIENIEGFLEMTRFLLPHDQSRFYKVQLTPDRSDLI